MKLSREVVLVTGAGGSIGSAVCEALATEWGCKIIALDCDDTALHELAIRMEAVRGSRVEYALADVANTFDEIWPAEKRITTVIHAAAIKHVGIAEKFRMRTECVNVGGTNEALACAEVHGARFLLVSSDKAASARCFMGKTKKQAEEDVFSVPSREWRGAIRLGNVWWSRGSVLPTWDMRRKLGLPLPCARGNITRFGLTAKQASDMILRALSPTVAIPTGSIIVPTAMWWWRLADLATAYLRVHPECKIDWRKMAPCENAHEILFQPGDRKRIRTLHGLGYAGAVASGESDLSFLVENLETVISHP